MASTEVLDGGGLHCKLDEVEREEPDGVPDPDDTDPATGEDLDVGEAPVGVHSDDRRDDLSDEKGTHESEGRALHEVRTRDEDKDLRDDGDLEVDDYVQLSMMTTTRTKKRVGMVGQNS